jgi:hypothetical protein
MSRVFNVELPIFGTANVCVEAESKEDALRSLRKGEYDDCWDVNWGIEDEDFKAITVDDLYE